MLDTGYCRNCYENFPEELSPLPDNKLDEPMITDKFVALFPGSGYDNCGKVYEWRVCKRCYYMMKGANQWPLK